MSDKSIYENPLITRYASRAMAELWGERRRIGVWRDLWIALAKRERELGLTISETQIASLERARDHIDFAAAAAYERRFRHDVMAHVHAYGDAAPEARAIIHLGATSCYVTDNADLILMRDGLSQLAAGLVQVIRNLATFAKRHRDLPTLGFTHFQAAQLTTVGKRACLHLQDLLMDLEDLESRRDGLKFRGVKGTTGTQASFLKLFAGDHAKVKRLDQLVAESFGFVETFAVTGQTYSRKVDARVLDVLSGIAQSAHKFATDLRLLAHRKEVEEPFESEQIGSSAMAYKRNPMRSERICGLSRFLISLVGSAPQTEATQWLERTLDDSANRRLVIPQAFLAADAILRLYANVTEGLVVYPNVIRQGIDAELPFMATENVMFAVVAAGGDRQEAHERIRVHSQAAAQVVKLEGKPNDLIDRLRSDPAFASVDWNDVLDPSSYVGRAPEQVDDFLAEHVQPVLERYAGLAGPDVELTV